MLRDNIGSAKVMLGGDAGNGPCALGWPSTSSCPAIKLETAGDTKGAAVLSVPI